MTRVRIAVFASGGGSNLGALLDHLDASAQRRTAEVVLVVSDRAAAGALERASARGIETLVLADPAAGDDIAALLRERNVQLLVLAGYLRLLPARVVEFWHRRVLNVHPAPLPGFGGHGMYGKKVHRAVLDSGATASAVSVHFVDEEYDRGPVIAQWPVAVRAGDTPDTLAARVLAAEHVVYPRIIEMVAALITEDH